MGVPNYNGIKLDVKYFKYVSTSKDQKLTVRQYAIAPHTLPNLPVTPTISRKYGNVYLKDKGDQTIVTPVQYAHSIGYDM